MKETPEARSLVMRAVKGKDTVPEMTVRRMVHRMGFRFRLHRKDIAGKPDLVFSGLRKVIFVNGCFWHGHKCARGARQPKTNVAYWRAKIARNRARDEANAVKLQGAGWRSAIVWECELKDPMRVKRRLTRFLGSP